MTWIPDETLDRLRAVASAPDLAGTKYDLIEPIGRGGMGVVYLASDTELGRVVAMKVLDTPRTTADLEPRLLREAKVLAQLEHPGIVPVHDVGRLADGRLFYTMKFVRGQRLDHFLAGAPSLPERLRTFLRICEAVAFAHDRGVLHRDLKPSNVMVGTFGEVLVMDWGVAKVLALRPSPAEQVPDLDLAAERPLARTDGRDSTEHGVVMGTPGYMAPEQARGEVESLDARADVYSLGALLRYVLSDHAAAAEATTLELGSEPSRRENGVSGRIPRRLAAVVHKAMAAAPGDRYAGANELADEIERFLDDRAVAALPESIWTRGARFVARHRVAVILILVYVIVRALVLLLAGR